MGHLYRQNLGEKSVWVGKLLGVYVEFPPPPKIEAQKTTEIE